MHEISICQTMIDMLENEFSKEELFAVREVHMKVGELSCVEPEFIKQIYRYMIIDSPLEHSSLLIERIGILAKCETCDHIFKVINNIYACPLCETPTSKLVEGNELCVQKIVFEDFSHEEVN